MAVGHVAQDTQAAARRDALIYLPGLAGLSIGRKTSSGVVRRLQAALDAEAASGPATFRVEWKDAAVAGGAAATNTPLATVLRADGDDERAVLDVFQYDPSTKLVEGWEESNLFRRAARVVLAVVFRFPTVIRSFFAARHTTKGARQLFVACLMLLVMVAYAITLGVAVYQAVEQVVRVASGEGSVNAAVTVPAAVDAAPAGGQAPDAGSAQQAAAEVSPGVTSFQWIAILGALVAALWKRAGDRVRAAGASLFAANSYLTVAERQTELVGGLRGLCNQLRDDATYADVHVVAYSFGSIVALDALFPCAPASAHSYQRVATLVTIGTPYDFVLAARPTYFDDRHRAAAAMAWHNVYSDVDILGANFREDGDAGDATRGITVGTQIVRPVNHHFRLNVDVTTTNLLELHGFRSHGMYWGDDDVVDVNVFDQVVRVLYDGGPVLA